MNLPKSHCVGPSTARELRTRAFTLIEAMVGMGLFSLVVMALIASHFASLEFTQFILPKVQNSQNSRQALGMLIEEVRSASSVQVGTGTLSSFLVISNSNKRIGNAVKIFPSTNSTKCIYYYQDFAAAALYKIPYGASNPIVVVGSLTNKAAFSLEDFKGNVLTNPQNSEVLSVLLQVSRSSVWNGLTDTAQIRARVTRRNIL